MMKMLTLGAAIMAFAAAPAVAQQVEEHTTVVKEKKPSGAAGGAATGAVAGAVVGGPVGAAVGAAAGAVVGHTVAPPAEVRTYVTRQDVPVVTYGHPVVVGRPVEGDVVWLDVPRYEKYRWAYLDGHRVVVDAETHEVVAVY